MDKAQEKIDEELITELFNELLSEFNLSGTKDVEVRVEANNIAMKMAKVINKLGYHKPLGSLELREKIKGEIVDAHLALCEADSKADTTAHSADNLTYAEIYNRYTDQILALLIPKGE